MVSPFQSTVHKSPLPRIVHQIQPTQPPQKPSLQSSTNQSCKMMNLLHAVSSFKLKKQYILYLLIYVYDFIDQSGQKIN